MNYAIVALLPIASITSAQEYAPNGGFEEPFVDGIGEGWGDNSSWANLDVEYSRDDVEPHGGDSCQKITLTRFGDGAIQTVLRDPVALENGAIYRVSGWFRGTGGQAALQLRFAPAPYTVYVEQHVNLGDEWQEISCVWTSSVDDPAGLLMIRLTDSGVTWVDDVSVRRLSPDELLEFADEVRPGNLLHNGDFDLGTANWLVNHGVDYTEEPRLSVEESSDGRVGTLVVPAGVHVALSTDAVPVASGQPLRFSCEVRAEPAVSVLANCASIWRTVDVGSEWQTVEGESTAPFQPEPHAFARFTLAGPTTLFLGRVGLRQTDDAEVEIPKAAAIVDRHPMSLYHVGETPRLRLLSGPGSQGMWFNWVVRDFWGNEVRSGRWRGSPNRLERDAALGRLGSGYYHVTVSWTHNEQDLSNESAFAILPPPERASDAAQSPFGAHFPVTETGIGLARAVGVRWLRLHPPNHTKWRVVEPQQGQWAWRDKAIRTARAAGLSLIGSLDRLPDWASTAPEDFASKAFYTGKGAWVPRDWGEWENYVTETVRRHKSDIHIWEIWNEPNLESWLYPREGQTRPEAYVEMLGHTYPIVKREDPDAVVWGACIAGAVNEGSSQLEFADSIIGMGALDLMDVFSFHEYISYAIDERGDPIETWTERLRERMRAAGRELPLVNSEGGFSSPGTALSYRPGGSGYVPADRMASLIVRQHVSQFAAGVEQFYFYNFFIDGSPVVKDWEGFLEGDGQPLPNVPAYAVMTWLLDGAEYLRTERPNVDAWIHHFQTPSGPLAVAWTRSGTRRTLAVEGATEAFDVMGAPVEVATDEAIEITEWPTYIRS